MNEKSFRNNYTNKCDCFLQAGQDIRDGEFAFSVTQQPDQTPPTAPRLLQNTDTTDTNTAPASVHFPDTQPSQTLETHETEASLQELRNEEICERAGEGEAMMRCLVDIQRRAERRYQRDRDRQLLRVSQLMMHDISVASSKRVVCLWKPIATHTKKIMLC